MNRRSGTRSRQRKTPCDGINMKVVIDECLPRRLANALAGHKVWTVQQIQLNGLLNGALTVLILLVRRAAAQEARNTISYPCSPGTQHGVL